MSTEPNVTPIQQGAKLTSHTIMVTPEIAQRWLEWNQINRALSSSKVAQYARAMAGGHWMVSNDDICFDRDGRLLNGQHRLHAVVRSGCTILMTVKRGLPTDAMQYMDRGKGRTYAQNLTFANERNANVLGAALRQIVLLESGSADASSVGDDEMNAALGAHPEIRESITRGRTASKHVDASTTALALAHWLISRANTSEVADYFLDQLTTRANEPVGSAIHAIDSRLRSVKRDRSKVRIIEMVHFLIKGWNYYAAGRPVRTLTMPQPGEKFPTVKRWTR